MRKLFVLLLVVAALICVIGCSNEGAVQMGTLNIVIDSSISRGISPIPMEIHSYNVSVENSSEVEVFSSTADKHTEYTIPLPVGAYTIKVQALNKAGDIIGGGSGFRTVEATPEYSTVTITVEEFKGVGTFNIAIAANSGYTLEYTIYDAAGEEVEKDAHGEDIDGKLLYDGSKGLYSASIDLDNGFYQFTIYDKRTIDKDKREYKSYVLKNDTVRIVAWRIASYEAEFLIQTNGAVEIDKSSVLRTPVISLELNSAVLGTGTLKTDESLTVVAEVKNINGYEYWWTVDGEKYTEPTSGSSTPFSLVFSKEEVAAFGSGSHTVALFVRDADKPVVWSEFKDFTVLSETPKAIEVKGETEFWFVGDVLIPYDFAVNVKIGENSYSFNPRSSVHRVDKPEVPEVKPVVIQAVSDENYYAYLDYKYVEDGEKEKTVVYITLDRDIEDAGHIVLNLDNPCTIGDSDSLGVWFRADKTVLNPAQAESYSHRGFVTVVNGETSKEVKVDSDKYSIVGATESLLKYDLVYDRTAVRVKTGETENFEVKVVEYTTFVKVGVPAITTVYPEFEERVESISFHIGENEIGTWNNGSFPSKDYTSTKRLTKWGENLPVKAEIIMKDGSSSKFFEYEIVPDKTSMTVEEGNTYEVEFTVQKKQ